MVHTYPQTSTGPLCPSNINYKIANTFLIKKKNTIEICIIKCISVFFLQQEKSREESQKGSGVKCLFKAVLIMINILYNIGM